MKHCPPAAFMFAVFIVMLSVCLGPRVHAAQTPTNFVIVLADDMGYGDLGCYGHPQINSPNLDRFATQGLRLTDCYSAGASCSPSRTGLMTGRTPYRVGIHKAIPMFSPAHLHRDEITIATLLKNNGYQTAHVGKWHLNGHFNNTGIQPQPNDHGFDYWFSTQNNALPNHKDPYNFVRNGIPVGPLKGFAADIVADDAVRWLKEERKADQPFFLYVCFHEPHEPITTAKYYADLYDNEDPRENAYYGNVTQMDHAFGRLMNTLDSLQLTDSTFVLFTSDNGPAQTKYHPHGSPGPLREKKGHVYDGGIRVPGMIRWPGRIKPNSVSSQPVCGVDLLPTMCEIAGVEYPGALGDRVIDGASLLPLFEDKTIQRSTPLFWQYVFSPSAPKIAMRIGDWKILGHLPGANRRSAANISDEDMQFIKTAQPTKFELYHVGKDIGESKDLAETEPERLASMSQRLKDLYREIQEENRVWPAWESPRYESKRIEWPVYEGIK